MKDTLNAKVVLCFKLSMVLLIGSGCSPNPVSQGKPLSDWVKALSDADDEERAKALVAISRISEGEGTRAKSQLLKLMESSNSGLIRGRSAAILVARLDYAGKIPVRELYSVGLHDGDFSFRTLATSSLLKAKWQAEEIVEFCISKLEEVSISNPVIPTVLAGYPELAKPALEAAKKQYSEDSMSGVLIEVALERISKKSPGN